MQSCSKGQGWTSCNAPAQASPLRYGKTATRRSRSCWVIESQCPHASQSVKTQSLSIAASHSSLLQLASCSRGPWQGIPPFLALSTTLRTRVWTPPPHILLHSSQSSQVDSSLQSTTAVSGMHSPVSAIGTCGVQCLPPFMGSWVICRLRYFWYEDAASHLLHSSQLPTMQSIGRSHCFGHDFVSTIGPSQGLPMHSLCCATARRLSHS
mmetsp:Transcript_14871/g.29336  ORF Transcript_14871/g.29336 Transcript_14871/m.29336 type:complete len:209 (+) Transcript_14871:760-1386(+)